jgi:hypothetical protein
LRLYESGVYTYEEALILATIALASRNAELTDIRLVLVQREVESGWFGVSG